MLDYLPEATNNRDIIYNKIRECGNIEVACVYCNLFYIYTNTRDINTCDGHTVMCNKCNVDCIVPITNQSKLVTECKTRIEMNELLNEWHKDGFSLIDDEKDYEDYGYDNEYDPHDNFDEFYDNFWEEECKDSCADIK
jgi:hypothetical protein